MEKKIEDYLYLYIGCPFIGKYKGWHSENEVMYLTHNDFQNGKFEYIKPILRPFSDMNEVEAVELIKTFDEGLSEKPEFKIIGKEGNDWIYVELGYEGTECCYMPSYRHHNSEQFLLFIKFGFDIFGLIESGLAIDKTKINNPN